jgi:uncharacterized membrane protein (UPF0127 family)
MAAMKVIEKQGGKELVERCALADSFVTRLVGLLNHDSLAEGEGLLITSCRQVHTLFMRFAIDAVFLDDSDTVVRVESLRPWRFSGLHLKASKVLELPFGAAERGGLKPGLRLEFVTCSN